MITLKSTYNELFERHEGLLKTLKDVQAELVTANETITSLELKVTELRAEAPINPEEYAQLKAKLEVSDLLASTVLETNSELEEKVHDLETDDKNFEEAVASKALEITTAQGVPPLAIKPEQPTSSPVSGNLVEQLNAIEDSVEQRRFWEANRDALIKLLKNHKS